MANTHYPHRIRLRGPWECEPIAWTNSEDERELPAPRRMKLPCRWHEGGLTDFEGTVRFRRRFGYPGQIDDNERVWLTFEGIEGQSQIRLNDIILNKGHVEKFEHDVTSMLAQRNELIVEITGSENAGLFGEVALEIRRTAFLSNVKAERKPNSQSWRISGIIQGHAERALDVYLLANNSTLSHQSIKLTESSTEFEFGASWAEDSPEFRVELVDGGIVWYTLPCP